MNPTRVKQMMTGESRKESYTVSPSPEQIISNLIVNDEQKKVLASGAVNAGSLNNKAVSPSPQPPLDHADLLASGSKLEHNRG